MDSTQEDNYLQKVTELVYDDNEIVTSTILGNILNIKVDCAQALLEKYVQNADVPDQTDVSWTYLVIGKNEDSSISILLAKNNEIDEKKNTLKSIISQQVYSVQKSLDIDLIALANVEPFTENNIRNKPLIGSVVSRNAIKRKLNAIPKAINEGKGEIKEPVKQNGSTNKTKKSSIESFCTKGNTQNNSKSTSNIKPKPKNMMANFLSKVPTKREATIENNCHSKQSAKLDNVHEDLPTDIPANIEPENDNDISGTDTDEKRMEVDSEPETKKKETSEVKKNESDDKNITKQNKKSKKRRTQGKSDQPSKKRKRIIEANGSDSDIFASSESEVEVVPDIVLSDDNCEEEIKVETTLPTKTRRMKQITEEFMDEDGYINTVQKYLMISDDEADENKEQKHLNIITEKSTTEVGTTKSNKDAALPVKKEISPRKSAKNNKGKSSKGSQNQPSIMNFFKKT